MVGSKTELGIWNYENFLQIIICLLRAKTFIIFDINFQTSFGKFSTFFFILKYMVQHIEHWKSILMFSRKCEEGTNTEKAELEFQFAYWYLKACKLKWYYFKLFGWSWFGLNWNFLIRGQKNFGKYANSQLSEASGLLKFQLRPTRFVQQV